MDAWSLGGIDPASGTAVLIEIARAYGHMKDKKGKLRTLHNSSL